MKLCMQSVVCYTSLKSFIFREGAEPKMSFAILHMQKLKQPAIKGIQIHNQREKESQTNPDIEEDKSHLNYDLVNPEPVDYNEKVNGIIEDKVTTGKAIRKDAVRVASFLVTSDKSYFDGLTEEREKEFFEKAYEFFCDEYGKENIAYAMVHKDEKTPHMHVGFVPITEDGRLSAKDFFGKKSQMFELQDKFHNHLKESGFELDRGVSSNRKHIETARFKALTLEEQNKALEKELQKKEELQAKIEKIESVEYKEQKSIFNKSATVVLSKDDFENIQNDLKKAIATRDDRENLIKEIDQAKGKISELEEKNKELENINWNINLKMMGKSEELKDLEGKFESEVKRNEDLQKENNRLKDRNNKLQNELNHVKALVTLAFKGIGTKVYELKDKIPKEFFQFYQQFHNRILELYDPEVKKEKELNEKVEEKKEKTKDDFGMER